MGVLCSTIEIGNSNENRYYIFSIEFNYYGMDSKQIEEIITIPLEEKIMTIPGLTEFRSSCEYGKSLTTTYFSKKSDYKNTYLILRSIIETLYSELPSDVQKPRLYNSSSDQKSVIAVAFFYDQEIKNPRTWIEKNIKPKLESINGVSEVIVSGGKQEEIQILFDTDKVSHIGQSPSDISSIIQDANTVYKGSKIKNNKDEPFVFNTKIQNTNDINRLPVKVGEGYTILEYVAEIKNDYRDIDEIVRINGKDCVSINIQSSSQSNNIKISKECKEIIDSYKSDNFYYSILYDNGKKQKESFKSVITALLESLLLITFIIPLFFSNIRTTILIIVSIPFVIVWSIGDLALFGFTLNENTLAGITISLGLLVDPILILAENIENSTSESLFIEKCKGLKLTIISASLTTIFSLVPLIFMDSIIPGIKNITYSIIFMTVNSVIIAEFFLPYYLYSEKNISIIPKKVFYKFNRFYNRNTIRLSILSIRKKRSMSVVYIFIALIPFVLFILSGKDLQSLQKDNVIFCSVDFDPEQNVLYTDSIMNSFTEELKKESYIDFVKINSKKGSCEIEVGFDPKKIDYNTASKYINSLSYLIPKGYLYVPELSSKKKVKVTQIEIACIGDENKKCRTYAEEIASIIPEFIPNSSVVLNFKKPETEYKFYPDKTKMAINGSTTSEIGSTLRWMMFGPVSDKWIQEDKEIDIRIIGKGIKNSNLETVENLYIPSNSGSVRLAALGNISKEEGSGRIYRKNGKRCAYITAEIEKSSLSKSLKNIKNAIKNVKLERGYGFSFQKEAEELPEQYKTLFISLICTVIFIFLLLTWLSEKPLQSLLIISIIPASYLLPISIKFIFGTPFELGDITGMAILAGLTVNNTIYITESKHNNYLKVRDKIKSILVSSITTILSSIPLLFTKGDSFSKSMAFFISLGIMASIIICLTVYPAVNMYGKSNR